MTVGTDIPLNLIEALHGDIEPVTSQVFDQKIIVLLVPD